MLASIVEIVVVAVIVVAALAAVAWTMLRGMSGKGPCACGKDPTSCSARSRCQTAAPDLRDE